MHGERYCVVYYDTQIFLKVYFFLKVFIPDPFTLLRSGSYHSILNACA